MEHQKINFMKCKLNLKIFISNKNEYLMFLYRNIKSK